MNNNLTERHKADLRGYAMYTAIAEGRDVSEVYNEIEMKYANNMAQFYYDASRGEMSMDECEYMADYVCTE